MSEFTEIDENEAPPIAPDAEKPRPVHPEGEYEGVCTKWAQDAFTFTNQKGEEEIVRYDNISVKLVHPELGICFVNTSAFDRRYNTNFAPESNSSAARFRRQCGVDGYSNAQLKELLGSEGKACQVKVVNTSRKDKKNLDADGKPTVVVDALIANIEWV